MNVSDWSGDTKNRPLPFVIILMGSISAVIIVIAIIFAFGPPPTAAARMTKEKIKDVKDGFPSLKEKLKWRRQEPPKPEEEEEDNQSPAGPSNTLNGNAPLPRPSLQERFSAAFLHTHKRHDSAFSGTEVTS
jgi:hypothetical protein